VALPGVAPEAALVGRGRELATLAAHLHAVTDGHGRLVLVSGEPGIGKSRLLAELGARARAAGWVVLGGAAYDAEGMPPYLPLLEALQAYVRACPPEKLTDLLGAGAAEVARLAPEVRARLPHVPAAAPAATAEERFRLFEAVTDFLLAIARAPDRAGLVLCLDDLHWADEATLLLVEHLVRRLAEAPLLVVVAYRDTETPAGRPFARTLERLRRPHEAPVELLTLTRLPSAAVAALLQRLSGREPPPSLVDVIIGETEGNPFFVGEVYRYLVEAGRLLDETGAWRTDVRVGDVDVPQTVRLAIAGRLGRVSLECRRLLGVAAVIGRTFPWDLVRVAAGGDEEALLDALDEAMGASLLEPGEANAEGHMRFAHELIRQTLLAEMNPPRRQRLHARVATAIEQVYAADLTPHLAALAGHYQMAGAAADPATVLDRTSRAAEAAAAVFAWEEAEDHWQAALDRVPEAEQARRFDLLLILAGVQLKAGLRPRARQSCQQAATIARRLGLPELLARTALALGAAQPEPGGPGPDPRGSAPGGGAGPGSVRLGPARPPAGAAGRGGAGGTDRRRQYRAVRGGAGGGPAGQ
jgi:predicted ATPase